MAVLKVPVTKGKGFIEIDTEALPDAVFAEAMLQGLKVILNRGMSKISVTGLEGEALEAAKAAAMAKAEDNKAAMLAGKIRIMGAKADKVSGAVMTEARRLARNLVKDQLKRLGEKVSHYAAKDITLAANALIAADPTILEKAKASLEERSAVKVAIDVTAIPTDPKKIEAIEKKKAKDQLSAAKAGKTKKSKPLAQANV